jgi:hypothetical protein
MAGYSKQFLVDAYLSRFILSKQFSPEQIESLEVLASKCYDTYGKEKFRTYASLDADAIKEFKQCAM